MELVVFALCILAPIAIVGLVIIRHPGDPQSLRYSQGPLQVAMTGEIFPVMDIYQEEQREGPKP